VYIKSLKCTLIEYAKKFGEGAIMNIVRGKDQTKVEGIDKVQAEDII